MGQFSWLDCIDDSQIVDGKRVNVYALVPKEFGGGHITERCYDGYGEFDGKDIYDLVAVWNRKFVADNPNFVTYKPHQADGSCGKRFCDFPWYPYFSDMSLSVEEALKKYKTECGEHTCFAELRNIGIDIACYDEQNRSLPFPIKITHDKYAVYENCSPSDSDPNQGWEEYDSDDDDYDEEDDYQMEARWNNDDNERYSLVGIDGNAYAVMGYVINAMKETDFDKDEIDEYLTKAKSGDYNNLLRVSLDYIDQCNSRL